MAAGRLEKQSIVGIGPPYVFVESVKIKNASLRDGDYSPVNSDLEFVKNKFGTNKKVKEDTVGDKFYFSNDNVYSVELNLFLNDMFISNFWYGKKKSINVKIIQSTHPLLTRRILDNDIRDISHFSRKYRKFLQEKIVAVPMIKPLASHRVKRLDAADDVICSIPVRAEFVANSNHLTYFAFVEGSRGYSKSYRTVERVLENNRPKQKSTAFYLPDGQVYSGPVHYHPGSGWMVGERHTRAPHPALRKVDHLNLKVHDYRVFKRLKEAQNSIVLAPAPESGRRVFSLGTRRAQQEGYLYSIVRNISRETEGTVDC